MRESTFSELNASDETLVAHTRRGDRRAYAELWRRHYRSGITVARSFTSLDADDLVSEAFARIYQRTLAGGGPKGAFRPYLYTTIRNLASTWGTARAKHVNVDEIDDFEPTESADEPAARSLDRTLTVQAYRSLPARWQTVLWYTEVEALDPSEVAPILGMSANGVAALSYRAREGLRKAWLQAHVSDATATGTCAWVIERLGERSRKSLTERESQKLESHLATCAKCSIVSEEVDDVGSRLAIVVLPIVLGGVVGGSFLATSVSTGGAIAASAIPALPAGIGAATGGAVASTSVIAIAASTVVVAAAGVGAVGIAHSNDTATAATQSSSSQAGKLADPLGIDPTAAPSAAPTDPADVGTDPKKTTSVVVPTPAPTPVVSESAPAPSAAPSTPSAPSDPASSAPEPTKAPSAASTPAPSAQPTTAPKKSVGDAVGGVVGATTGTVDSVVGATTGTVDSVVTGTTGVVDSLVDTLLPSGGVTGALNGTVDGVTGTVNGLTGTVTSTLNGTVNGVTGLLGGLLGGGAKH